MSFLDDEDEEDIAFPSNEKLSRLTELARRQIDVQAEIEELQLRLRQREEVRDIISEREIPELLHEIGVKELTLLDGHKVKIQPFYTGKITSPEAYEWLDSHGYGDMVRINITVSCRMADSSDTVAKVRNLLNENHIEWDETQGVHHSTLKAWIKDTIQTGQPIDRELFSVYTGFKTIIK